MTTATAPFESNQNSNAYPTLLIACGVAMATMVPVALFQTGIVHHLPDPPRQLLGRYFASEKITDSKVAHPFGVPDSLLGLASYGTTLALALCAPHSRIARKSLGAKLLLDGSMAARNTWKQFATFKRVCSWCMATAVSTAVMVTAGRQYLHKSSMTRADANEPSDIALRPKFITGQPLHSFSESHNKRKLR